MPFTWEVDGTPLPPPESATYGTDPRIDESQQQLDMTGAGDSGLQTMHPIGALHAQECVRMTAGDFRSMIFLTQYRVPSYAKWLLYEEADMAPAYRWHRKYLQVLRGIMARAGR